MRSRLAGWLVASVLCLGVLGCSGGAEADPYKNQPMPERTVGENVKHKGDAQ